MKKQILITLLTFFCSYNFFSQNNLLEHIPTNQNIVVTINGESLFNKVKNEELKKLEIYQSIVKELNDKLNEENEDRIYYVKRDEFGPSLLLMGDEFGVNKTTTSYFISGKTDSINYSGYLFSLNDHEKFLSFIKKVITEEEYNNHVQTKNGYQYYFKNEYAIAWNNEIAYFISYYADYFYGMFDFEETIVEEEDDNYYENYEDRYNDLQKKREEKEQKKLESALNIFFNGDPQLSLLHNKQYMNTIATPFDVSYYINGLGSSYSSAYGMLMGRNQMDSFISMFNNNYTYINLIFDENEVKIASNQHVSDKFLENTKDLNSARFNQNLFKYIDGSKLIGIMGMATNPEASYELISSSYADIMRGTLGEEGAIATEIFFTLLDEEEIFDLFKGNMIFAVTGVEEFDISYTTYEYDEDFNSTEITKTKKESLPEFVFAANVGNDNLSGKIIRLMESSGIASKKGNYYKYTPFSNYYNNNSGGMEIFFAIKGDVLLITNDYKLVTEQLENGVPKNNRINKKVSSMAKKNNLFGYWNGNETMERLKDSEMAELKDFKIISEAINNTFGEVFIEGVHQNGNEFTTNMRIETKEVNSNSLVSILNFANKLYLTEK